MEYTKPLESGILKQKILFFFSRILSYSIFLLIPFWNIKIADTNSIFQVFYSLFYLIFIFGQWYLLGKEIDYRLKIYYRTSSSMDRIVYRVLVGSVFLVIIFNIFSIFPYEFHSFLFWSFFTLIGLYYSWPTRGKIINESASTQLSEYRFLDSFEKSVLFCSILMVLFSMPEIPKFTTTETLKLYIDPNENISAFFWNYINFLFLPFKNFQKLNYISWCAYFFYVGFGFYLFALYAIFRSFYSRRLALLGVFAVISSWSIPKLLAINFSIIFNTTFILIWIWAIIWSVRSATYRSGFMLGLIHFVGVMYNPNYSYLIPITLILLMKKLLNNKTAWYKKQIIKYMLLGIVLSILTLLNVSDDNIRINPMSLTNYLDQILMFYDHKGFYVMSFFGIMTLFAYKNQKIVNAFGSFKFDFEKMKEIFLLVVILHLLGISMDESFLKGFSLIWFIVFLSVLPLEWMFQSINVLRSKRDLIFFFYVLVCLMDSHFEGRIKTFFKLLNF